MEPKSILLIKFRRNISRLRVEFCTNEIWNLSIHNWTQYKDNEQESWHEI